MSHHPRRRAAALRAAVAAAFCAAALAPALVVPTPADAASGSWAGLPYRAGKVCTDGTQSAPLTSWDLGVGTGYLTSPVAQNGPFVTGVPPLSSQGAQTSTPVVAGTLPGLDDSSIPALAALLGRYGDSSDDTTVAALAHLVMSTVGGGALPTCADADTESRLSVQSQALAGPWTVAFAAHAGKVRKGVADSTAVTVTGASGTGVPGAQVTVTADAPVLAGGTRSTTVTTGSDGTARVPVRASAGSDARTLDLHATAAVSTGLTEVTVAATPSAANPTGASVPALVPTAPQPATADQTLDVDTRAHPQLTVTADPAAALVKAQITPVLTVDGLEGNPASATVTSTGPLPLTDSTLCSTRTAGDFASLSGRSVSGTVSFADDGTVRAPSWTAQSAGCYWITATVRTTSATPQASDTASIAHPVLIMDVGVDGHLQHTLVGRNGSTQLLVRTQHTHRAQLSVRTTLSTPVNPGLDSDGCASASYTGTGGTQTTDLSTPRTASGDAVSTGSIRITSPGAGCTQVRPALVVHASGSDPAQDLVVDVQLTGGDDLLTLAPTVTATTARTWGQTGSPLDVQVSTASTFRQAAHVQVRLLRTDASEFGCRGVSFRGATTVAAGPKVATDADYTSVTAHSVVLSRTGCYEPVAVLTMDADPSVTAVSSPTADSVVGVGIGPVRDAAPVDRSGGGPPSRWLLITALIIFAALLVPSLVLVGRFAREHQGREDASGDLFDRPGS